MNSEIRDVFHRMKPICDSIMVLPTQANVANFVSALNNESNEHVQILQQYLLYPLITHIRSTEMNTRRELQRVVVEAMVTVLEKVKIESFEMCMKLLTGLVPIIFDKTKPAMIASIPEELKLSIMRCLTTLMFSISTDIRIKLLKTQVPLLAQTIFVSVQMGKQEKLRSLRLAALKNVTACAAIHERLTDEKLQITDSKVELLVIDMLASILPGILTALQEIAMSPDNPGHAIVVLALNTMHRVLCTTMNDKHIEKKSCVTVQDFANMIAAKNKPGGNDVSGKGLKDIERRSPKWYEMASEKLVLVIKSIVPLSTHDHFKVRKELAVLCARILMECNQSMRPSIPTVIDVLISLTKDEYPEVSEYCSGAIDAYFAHTSAGRALNTTDCLYENLFNALSNLPKFLNNIDSSRKLSALNLVHGYVSVLSGSERPQRLTAALTSRGMLRVLTNALQHAASLDTRNALLATRANRDLSAPPPTILPWLDLRYLDTPECLRRLQEICQLLGEAECAELLLDHFLEVFQQRECELAFIMNCFSSTPNILPTVAMRILDTYLEEDLWYLPLELGNTEPPVGKDETLDIDVYNPRAWMRDSVPGLFEGTTEIRYTGISYDRPRQATVRSGCSNVAHAQRNLALCCLLTEGVGIIAISLREHFQPYLLKTLCLILERVGSRYEALHLAGLKAINDITRACGHATVAELIAANGDYITNQVTNRLKKVWNIQSALEILSVVIEYSDTGILDYLYGIVDDVLVQSCDKYYERDLYAYLQVFLTFITCIRKWFPVEVEPDEPDEDVDVLKEALEYDKNKKEMERLLKNEDEDERGMSVEEMYTEDMKKKEEDILDYDDTVTKESPPPPRHVTVTISIIKRCVNFVTSQRRDDSIMAMKVLAAGLPVLQSRDDDLLPLVHAAWTPLCTRFDAGPPLARQALELLLTMASLSKDFIRSRAVKEVLPRLYKLLHRAGENSLLKDKGSAYRCSGAYRLQYDALAALPRLARDLRLSETELEDAMRCVTPYLSKKQPKPLQELAVEFFQGMLEYNYGAAWYHLRRVCRNERHVPAPPSPALPLCSFTGTPYRSADCEYDKNIKLIFKKAKM